MGKKYLDIKENSLESSVYNVLHGIQETVKKEKLDPVGKEDGDIDNDGDKDASDKYLAKRRKTVAKAIKKDKKEGNAFGMALKSAKDNGEKTFVVSGKTYKVEGLEDSPNTANSQHLCAKNVVHENWGNGTPISGQHAEPDAEGDIAWYDVMFEHGIEKGVSINELKVTKAESHHHSEKKKKKMDEKVEYVEYKFKNKNEAMAAKKMLDAVQMMNFEINDDNISGGELMVDSGSRDMTKYHKEVMKKFKPKVMTQEEVDLEEGKMAQMHQMMKDKKSAEQIAKAMKLDLKTVKALMDGYNKMVPESFEIGTEKYLKHTVSSTPGQKAWNETVSKKAASMRETLAKIWEVDEGKNVFEKDTKKDLTNAVKGGKTMTGKKVAAVDTSPIIKEKKK